MDEKKCASCNSPLNRFLSLSPMPPVNSFISQEEISKEKSYPLNLAYCPSCLLVQLEDTVPPEELFSNYLHLSSGSSSNIAHLKEVADLVKSKFNISENTKILEIGSNDGTLLSFLKTSTNNLLGIDPAKNLFPLCKEKGIESLPLFFNKKTASDIIEKKGKFDIIIALNVIPHTPNVIDLLNGINLALSENGTLIMEGAYALDTILQGQFDTIYHEHVYSFSLHSLINTFNKAGLLVYDIEKIPTQGSSLRIFARKQSKSVMDLLQQEKSLGLTNPAIYDQVDSKVEKFKQEFLNILHSEKKGQKLIGLGAPARGMVILNHCGLTQNDFDYIIDDTPLKQGKFSPGTHIPVKSWESLNKNEQRTFVLLSWNYKDYLISKLKQHVSNSKVIVPFPKIEVLNI